MEKIFKIARNNDEIREWVENHGGKPAIIDDTEVGGDKVGLRIDFSGGKDEDMLSQARDISHDVSWARFFEVMDSKNYVFEYLDEEDLHNPAMSYRFLDRNNPQIDERDGLSDLV